MNSADTSLMGSYTGYINIHVESCGKSLYSYTTVVSKAEKL